MAPKIWYRSCSNKRRNTEGTFLNWWSYSTFQDQLNPPRSRDTFLLAGNSSHSSHSSLIVAFIRLIASIRKHWSHRCWSPVRGLAQSWHIWLRKLRLKYPVSLQGLHFYLQASGIIRLGPFKLIIQWSTHSSQSVHQNSSDRPRASLKASSIFLVWQWKVTRNEHYNMSLERNNPLSSKIHLD